MSLAARLLVGLSVLGASAACGGNDDAADGGTTGSGATGGTGGTSGASGTGGLGGGAAAAPACGTAVGSFPPNVEALSRFPEGSRAHVRAQDWALDDGGRTYVLAEEPLWEASRFDLVRPAKVHGFRVEWLNVPPDTDASTPLEAGLYPDFGHNGFDLWTADPLWTGTRCAGDLREGQPIDYVFAEPVEIHQPGMVYVAHRSDGALAPSFAFGDVEVGDDCAELAECRSALNLPDAAGYYNGISLALQFDFAVTLLVEYEPARAPEDLVFRAAAGPTGQRVSWGDYDADGWDDLYVGGRLHRNERGAFTDVTEAAGLVGPYVAGGVFGDYDNDGCLDLFAYSDAMDAPDTLFRSRCDGTFEDVTVASGVTDQQDYETCGDPKNTASPTAAAAWVDLDADGFLDLYVANYECPGTAGYYRDLVWHNRGDGTFESWSGTRGFSDQRTPSRGVAPADADGDGDVDIFVNNYRLVANVFFENQGDGTFVERAYEAGLSGEFAKGGGFFGSFGHTIGAAWGDLDGDTDFDLVAANLAHPRFYDFSDKTQILRNDGAKYTNLARDWSSPLQNATGLRYQETHSVPVLADVDLDGHLDLAITCVYDGRPMDFYWGNGDGTFRLDVAGAGLTTTNGWGVATSDFDRDGDADLFAGTLFENRLPAARLGNSLEVRAVGNAGSNTSAIGATVFVEAGGRVQSRHVQGGSGQGGQDSAYLVFGLGPRASADAIRVRFPGRPEVVFAGPFAAGARVWVHEDGTTHVGWDPP